VKDDIRIGIVGGNGRMGRWFHRLLSDAGFDVLVADLDTELSAQRLAELSDVVILSVPMDVFPQVVRDVAPHLDDRSFLTDLCSLKEKQVECMLKHVSCAVAGTHPLFGPGERELAGRRVALCPGRGEEWLSWWEELLSSKGALCVRFAPHEHDRTMAWVQALNHFILMCLGKSLEEDGIDFRHIMHLATPSFERQMDILGRLCKQDPGLYAIIQMENPYTDMALETFLKYGNELSAIIKSTYLSTISSPSCFK
jgi:prephenate dehydrogenase